MTLAGEKLSSLRDGCDVRNLSRKGHREGRSFSRSARNVYISAEKIGKSLCDREAKACSVALRVAFCSTCQKGSKILERCSC